ncbi:hypothetical protein MLD38_019675 [Melastoma candidum]|uniref:Uncharacterized protein n=1 Tax=Melastoma candidum TaxID=119954 RepID=A0ACB9QXU4_9MYRT|nr:hypothetical protein MLD38_019675 [Melastoma candidum]
MLTEEKSPLCSENGTKRCTMYAASRDLVKSREKLPQTDSRLRPDQRHLENGEYEKANAEKQRLEKRQRMSRKIQESGWEPRWFRREGEEGPFRYTSGYWESGEQTRWDGCPNIFGEFIEDAVDEFTSDL